MSSPVAPPREYSGKSKSNRKWAFILALATIVVIITILVVIVVILTDTSDRPMPKLQQEYQEKANLIIKYSIEGGGKGKAHEWMANISDRFGHRKIGSPELEEAINYSVEKMKNEYGLENVHTENVDLPHWVRGTEEAFLVDPRTKKLAILGLGSTVGTEEHNLTAPAVVVTSWDDLAARCNSTGDDGISGKIVVYNAPWTGDYGTASGYRSRGASEASRCGARAALIRSAASFSVNSPHTGQQSYQDGVKKIPAISLAPEDAEMIHRMQMRKQKITIRIFVTSRNEDDTVVSRNTIFDLTGSTYPEEIVMLNGHFDSWDVGAGAMDNGGGASIALRAILNLKDLISQNLLPQPKRTIRGIHWTAEEPGLLGSTSYYKSHKNDTHQNFIFLQEADMGFFRPLELFFSGSAEARVMFQEQIFPMIRPLNISMRIGKLGDSDKWASDGVPGLSMASAGMGYQRYFAFHHSEGDTPSVYEKNDLDVPAAIWAVVAYVVADMNATIPIGPRILN